MKTTRLFVTLLVLLSSLSARAGDFKIVPGKRIGSVVLGMNRNSVHKVLGSPQQTRSLKNGITQESWRNPLSAKQQAQTRLKATYWKWHYVVVYFQKNHAVQIDVNSSSFATPTHLTTANSAQDFRQHFRPFQFSKHLYINRDAGGIPASKHYLDYEDAVQSGIAWRYGAWGNLAPEPAPDEAVEAVIVHMPGHAVIPDPDGGLRFVQTSHDRH